ncbi:LysM peptidoglycan-binding domain-containing protein [Paenibacillus sedimenti]|uniref:LysM peptidoglycan-binding domain-containing protein n=1 Tax=Paenibacillus sedimenti TaxID=2770274 RepID=A0A926KUB8_9BACL|nr:LysM peptidoglycan-binding domain-containing protein [Paenibacillus sedimenti]MBD0382388.1 LysM peptidoglycan-binding domain-containing protein [Paenibacillus sedimenti]
MRVMTNRGTLKVKGRFYAVQFGDSLYTISQRFDVSVADLLTFNDQLNGLSTIYPGEILYIPVMNLQIQAKKVKNAARQG